MKHSRKQWWETLFDEKYLKTYVDVTTPESTHQQITFLQKALRLKKGAEILDVACGHGRHAIALARQGYQVTGLDFSKYFIDLAKKETKTQGVNVHFIQGDMRQLSFVNKFDAITNMFTSFGYFDSECDNELVLLKISRALKANGQFMIDINNGMRTLVRLVQIGQVDPETRLLVHVARARLSNGLFVETKEEFDPMTMRWAMTRRWEEDGRQRSYRTNVRLFSLPELSNMMRRNGLRVKKVWGDFHGAPFSFDAHRLIVLARKDTPP